MEENCLLDRPPEWSDDEKMTVLFSPFRESRHVNPNGWDGKLRFWKHCIVCRCMAAKTAVIKPNELPKMFERRGRVPSCLGTVVEAMIRDGQLCELSDVLLQAGQSWSSWTYDMLVKRPTVAMFNVFIKKPVLWTYSKLFSNEQASVPTSAYTGAVNSNSQLSDKQFVVIDVVKCLAKEIQKTFYGDTADSNKDRLVSMAVLRKMCQKCCPCDISFKLALSWLCREKKCIITEVESQGKVVVFADINKKMCDPPTDMEITVFKLNCTTEELQRQIEALQNQIESLRTEAKLYLQKGMKGSARSCLRRKKCLALQQSKKEAAIENIHQLLCTILQTETDKQVLDVYSSGVSAYKDITKKHGLTPDSVDDVMLGIQEVMDTQEELDHSIATTVLPGDVSTDELEQELNEILAGEDIYTKQRQVEPHQELINALCRMKVAGDQLPDVPSGAVAFPDDLPSVPDDLPSVPGDLPSVPGDLPALSHTFPVELSGVKHQWTGTRVDGSKEKPLAEHAFST